MSTKKQNNDVSGRWYHWLIAKGTSIIICERPDSFIARASLDTDGAPPAGSGFFQVESRVLSAVNQNSCNEPEWQQNKKKRLAESKLRNWQDDTQKKRYAGWGTRASLTLVLNKYWECVYSHRRLVSQPSSVVFVWGKWKNRFESEGAKRANRREGQKHNWLTFSKEESERGCLL